MNVCALQPIEFLFFCIHHILIWPLNHPPCSKLLIHTLSGPVTTWMCGEKDAASVMKNLRYWTQMVRLLKPFF
jgi:hypothetical protein